MRTNIVMDEKLVREAMRVTGLKTKRAVVEAGLRLLVQTKAQGGMRRLHDKIAWESNLPKSRTTRVPAIEV